ncbi:phosphonate ABC transporter, permease protein PhnE [Bavariicoccus seileri]|uniref:phosphonate ABC transporter, permease protein PhnE n=1 Tax=Bavariicoccus seileri TaxID=549685 RepID=UPI003F905091
MEQAYIEKLKLAPKNHRYILIMFLIIVGLLAWSVTGISSSGTNGDSMSVAKNIIHGIVTPDTELLFNWTKQGIPYLLFETIAIAFLGTIVGGVFAMPLAFLASSNIVPPVISTIAKLVIMFIRTIPSFVYGLMFIRVTGPGAFAGVMTMSVISIGMLTKLFSDSIEEIDHGVIEALDAIGCTRFSKVRYGVIPQLVASFLSTILYRFDMNLRDASILGLVGAGGIGAPLIFAMNAYRWNQVGSILVGLVVLILIVEYISTKLRTRLIKGVW